MLPEERKAIARLAHEAINHRDRTLRLSWLTSRPDRSFLCSSPRSLTRLPPSSSRPSRERVTTRTTLRGTHLGAFMGVAATGKAIEIMNISLDQIEEGKALEHFGVSDWLRALIVFEIVAAPTAVTSEAMR